MPSQKSIPISELITTANSELLRLDFKRSACLYSAPSSLWWIPVQRYRIFCA